jgi:hypothetical protein
MVKKSLHRFYILGLALVATLFFFGAKPERNTIHKSDKVELSAEVYSIHSSCPCHQPFEIENKEEQPTTEDDESKESGHGDFVASFDSSSLIQKTASLSKDEVVSKSQTEYHTPAYVRLRSILI